MALSNLPDRNPFFTGRADVLAQIRRALADRRRAALSGLGGVGKTQTALEYAHRYLAGYSHTFLVTAASREDLLSGYVTIASLLKLPEVAAQDQMLAMNAVKHWLGSNERWLLILDNADDLGMAWEFLPHGKKGDVLLTTRARATGAVARFVEIKEMETEEGALFLLRRSKHIPENALFAAASTAAQDEATAIATQLDGLPLALDQAGSYIEETGCGLLGYLDLYRSHAQKLLRHRGALPSDHPDPVATTWALSFENIEQASPAAAEILQVCAFLHPDDIPEEVFREGASELGPVLGPVGSDAFELNSSISEILKYSLLRRDSKARTLEIHRLVQAVLKQTMDEAMHRLWAKRAVLAVSRTFPGVDFADWIVCERLLPQAQACSDLIDHWDFEFSEAARLLTHAGFYLCERGRYTDAEPLYKRALAIREKTLGPEHPQVAISLNRLAWLLKDTKNYTEAESLFLRALAINEKVLGPEHLEMTTSLDSLAWLLKDRNRYSEAESLFLRALAINEKVLGPEQAGVAMSLNNLAELYRAQGQYTKAEPLHLQALAIRKKALGPEHRDLAWSFNNLALLYSAQHRYGEAEPLYQRALAIRKKALGPEHRDLAWSFNNLAELYRSQGQCAQAEPLYKQALAIYEKALGPEHRHVATCLENYASCFRAMGHSQDAEALESRAKVIRAKTPRLEFGGKPER